MRLLPVVNEGLYEESSDPLNAVAPLVEVMVKMAEDDAEEDAKREVELEAVEEENGKEEVRMNEGRGLKKSDSSISPTTITNNLPFVASLLTTAHLRRKRRLRGEMTPKMRMLRVMVKMRTRTTISSLKLKCRKMGILPPHLPFLLEPPPPHPLRTTSKCSSSPQVPKRSLGSPGPTLSSSSAF